MQAREKLAYLLFKGAGPKWRPPPMGPPLVMPAPPLRDEQDARLGRLEMLRAEMRFALAQAAPSLPQDVRRIVMGFAKLSMEEARIGLVKVRTREMSPCFGEEPGRARPRRVRVARVAP